MSKKDKQKHKDCVANKATNSQAIEQGKSGAVVLPRSLTSQLSPHERAREPVSPSTGRVVGKMMSQKNGRSLEWESQLEYKAMLLMEYSTAVQAYQEQPITFKIPLKDKVFRYTPDLRMTLKNGRHAFAEIKPLSKVLNPITKERLTAVSDYVANQGSALIVLTEVEIDQAQTLDTVKFLKPYSGIELNEQIIEKAQMKLFEASGSVTLAAFVAWFEDKKDAFAFVSQGFAAIDFNKAISATTLIRLPEEKDNENYLFQYRIAPSFA